MPTTRFPGALVIAALLLAAAAAGCNSLSYANKTSLGEWYLGPAGFEEAIERQTQGGKCSYYRIAPDSIKEDRPPWYGHFRMPELLFQPVGGARYPRRLVCVAHETQSRPVRMQMRLTDERGQDEPVGEPFFVESERRIGKLTLVERGSSLNHFTFDVKEAGILDCLIPYRIWNSDADGLDKVLWTAGAPVKGLGNVVFMAARAPVYALHDVIKLLALPFAAAHFSG